MYIYSFRDYTECDQTLNTDLQSELVSTFLVTTLNTAITLLFERFSPADWHATRDTSAAANRTELLRLVHRDTCHFLSPHCRPFVWSTRRKASGCCEKGGTMVTHHANSRTCALVYCTVILLLCINKPPSTVSMDETNPMFITVNQF
jgi:hypothetical protein